jgi:RNA polymerase sigma-32 factor
LAAKIAMGYRGYGLPIADLIAEGNVGLVQSVRGFDPERGFRFATYALWWIRAAIQEYILHSWSLVKIGTTAAQKKLFFNLRRLKGEMKAIDDGELRPEQLARIALELDVLGKDVAMMNQRLAHCDKSLNTPVRDEGGGEWLDRLADDRASQESAVAEEQELNRRRTFLSGALDRLTPREKHILTERRLKETPATLQSLSDYYGVSRERIRQIEIKAFEKLRKSAHGNGIATGVQQ